jgi:DNA polymerase IV
MAPTGRATILHADLDAFYASVEQRDDPSLRGRPIAVGPGVVLAASYEARAFGVRGAMGVGQAKRLCPDLLVVPGRFDAYVAASEAVFAIFHDTTPLVEGLSIDEAFLDVGGLWRISGEPVDIAARVRTRVRAEVDLPISIGVARTKSVAKVASQVGKPDGLLVVAPGEEEAFLHPLPIERLWGVGPKTAAKLHDRGIHLVGELARIPVDALSATLGGHAGRHLHAMAWGRDHRRVETGRRRRSIGSQCALGSRGNLVEADRVVAGLVDRVCGRMRRARRVGRTVVLRLRFGDFTRATRSRTLVEATASTGTVLGAVRDLLAAAAPVIRERGITLVGVSISGLDDADAVQLALPFERRDRGALDVALDEVRSKFGSRSVTRATLLGHRDLTMPLGPIRD